MEAGRLMSKTLPPKINLHEGREGRREKGRGGRERRRKGTSLSTGTEGKESLRFNGIKTAQFLEGAACSGIAADRAATLSASSAHRTGAGGFFAQMVFGRRKRVCAMVQKDDGTVQRCEISDESTNHVLLMGERFLSPGSDLSAYTHTQLPLPVSTTAPMDVKWAFIFFIFLGGGGILGGCVIYGDGVLCRFSTISLFQQGARHLPGRFWGGGLYIKGRHDA